MSGTGKLSRLFNLKYTGSGFQPEIQDGLKEKLDEYSKFLGTELTQTRVLGILDEVLGDNSICVGAAGSLPGDLQAGLPGKKRTVLSYGIRLLLYGV